MGGARWGGRDSARAGAPAVLRPPLGLRGGPLHPGGPGPGKDGRARATRAVQGQKENFWKELGQVERRLSARRK